MKESRVKLTLWGFTCNVFPDIQWLSDLEQFAKSPPGVSYLPVCNRALLTAAITQTFEAVIPSERTRISLKIMDGSIRVFAPTHPGAIVCHVGELNFSTDVVGNSLESSFILSIPALALLAVDDASDHTNEYDTTTRVVGTTLWTVRLSIKLATVPGADRDSAVRICSPCRDCRPRPQLPEQCEEQAARHTSEDAF